MVCQPGDTLQVRVIDLDLNLDPEVLETANATALNSATGELETFTLTEISVDDSVFFGLVEIASADSNPGDGILAVHKADSIRVSYVDELPASGDAVEVADTSLVVDQFGDADGNGLVQAFDASRVLAHVLAPSLEELDSLAANVDSLAPFSAISPYDAALILQHRVGMRRRFPVQESAALNHPQLKAGPAAPRPVAEERLLALRMHDGYVSVWASERSEIISGELVVEGITGRVELAAEMSHFLLASRSKEDGLHIVLAGAAPISGPGELLRVYPGAGFENAQLARAGFNSGSFVGRMEGMRASGAVASRFALYPNRRHWFSDTRVPIH